MLRTMPYRESRPVARLIAGLGAMLLFVVTLVVPQATVAYADASSQGGDYVPFTATRKVLDTRDGTGTPVGPKKAGTTTSFQVLGVGGIPTSGVSSVAVRVGAIAPTATTYLTVHTDGTPKPDVSHVNLAASEVLSNFAIVKPSANGKLAVYNRAGDTHIHIEVHGYFATNTGTTWGGLVSVPQTRVIDTRTGVGTTVGAIPPNGSRTVNLAVAGVPVGATAISAAVTTPPTTARGYFLSTPTGGSAMGLMDYENGRNNSSGTLITLGADGRVTFTNKGTAATHLIIDTQAYFTKTATAGAGLRPLMGRLFVGTVAANATVDVVVAGTNGMPTRAVAGAALSFQAAGTQVGTIRAWPAGQAEPQNVTLTQHPANVVHRTPAIIQPGTDGKVRVRNISAAAITLLVDIEGWFADPLPVLPVAQNTRVNVLQALPSGGQAVGALEYSYVDNIGRVIVAHQENLDFFDNIQFVPIGGNEAFTGPPALSHRPDGSVHVAAQHTGGGDIWTSTQTAPRQPTWRPWTDAGGSMAAPPAAIKLTNGTTVLFAIDADGKLWSYSQEGAVPFWRSLGDLNLTGTPVLAEVRDGNVQVFARDTAGEIRTMLFRVDGSVSPWTSLGGAGSGEPAAVVYPGYRLQVFARAADGTIVTKRQDLTGTFPEAWDSTGPLVAAGPPSAVLDPLEGKAVAAVRTADGIVHLNWESAPGSGVFDSWTPVNTPEHAAVTDPTMALVNNGRTHRSIAVFRTINGSVLVYGRSGALATLAAPVN